MRSVLEDHCRGQLEATRVLAELWAVAGPGSADQRQALVWQFELMRRLAIFVNLEVMDLEAAAAVENDRCTAA